MTVEQRLEQLGLNLPPAPPLGGIYHPVVLQGSLAYLSGQGPVTSQGTLIKGKVGKDLNRDEARLAARQVGLTMLATLKKELGSLDKIARLIKLFGMVNSTPDFDEHPYVINGCSELFSFLWGETNGRGARSAVGMAALPGNIAVEIEAIFELHP